MFYVYTFLPAYVYCIICVPDTYGGQKMVLDPLKLEGTVVSCYVPLGTWILCKSSKCSEQLSHLSSSYYLSSIDLSVFCLSVCLYICAQAQLCLSEGNSGSLFFLSATGVPRGIKLRSWGMAANTFPQQAILPAKLVGSSQGTVSLGKTSWRGKGLFSPFRSNSAFFQCSPPLMEVSRALERSSLKLCTVLSCPHSSISWLVAIHSGAICLALLIHTRKHAFEVVWKAPKETCFMLLVLLPKRKDSAFH